MIDYIVIGIIILVIGGASFYLVKQKRKGVDCIGCASASKCASSCQHCQSSCQITQHLNEGIEEIKAAKDVN